MSDYTTSISNGDFFSGNISATDSLVLLFSELFGNGWHEMGLDAVTGPTTESASMIIAILGAINVIALNAGALALGWLAFSATMGTAHEGQFLGKRFHDYWMPLRSGVSVFFLAPVAKGGLCVVQVIGLIFIGTSIQFANFIQAQGLDYMVKHSGRVVAAAVPPGMEENARNLAAGLLQTAVVQNHYRINNREKFTAYAIDQSSGYTFKFFGPYISFGEPQLLSSVQIPNYNTKSKIGLARALAVQDLYHAMDRLGYAIVTNATAEVEDVAFDHKIYEKSIHEYMKAVAPHIGELISDQNPDFEKELKAYVDKAKKDGVVWLGSYYHTLNRFAAKVNHISADYPSISPVDLREISSSVNILLESALGTVNKIEKNLKQKINLAQQNSGAGIFKKTMNEITYVVFGGMTNKFIASVTTGDPLANMADYGHYIMTACEAGFLAYLATYTKAGAAKSASDSLLGQVFNVFSGGASSAVTGGIVAFLSVLGKIVFLLLIPLFTLGLMLAVYLPMVPYIVWMSAIIGTIILWIEFLVHMPIWAITFATGEGEGITGQRSQQGLLLIANAIFRLPLMTAGFLIALVLIPPLGRILGETVIVAFADMGTEHIIGVPTMLTMMFVFGGFMILQSHVIFGLVTHLPEGAMKFFGGAMSSMGEAAHEGKTRAMMMASFGKGEHVGQQALGKNPTSSGNQEEEKGTQQSDTASTLRKTDTRDQNLGSKTEW